MSCAQFTEPLAVPSDCKEDKLIMILSGEVEPISDSSE